MVPVAILRFILLTGTIWLMSQIARANAACLPFAFETP